MPLGPAALPSHCPSAGRGGHRWTRIRARLNVRPCESLSLPSRRVRLTGESDLVATAIPEPGAPGGFPSDDGSSSLQGPLDDLRRNEMRESWDQPPPRPAGPTVRFARSSPDPAISRMPPLGDSSANASMIQNTNVWRVSRAPARRRHARRESTASSGCREVAESSGVPAPAIRSSRTVAPLATSAAGQTPPPAHVSASATRMTSAPATRAGYAARCPRT